MPLQEQGNAYAGLQSSTKCFAGNTTIRYVTVVYCGRAFDEPLSNLQCQLTKFNCNSMTSALATACSFNSDAVCEAPCGGDKAVNRFCGGDCTTSIFLLSQQSESSQPSLCPSPTQVMLDSWSEHEAQAAILDASAPSRGSLRVTATTAMGLAQSKGQLHHSTCTPASLLC